MIHMHIIWNRNVLFHITVPLNDGMILFRASPVYPSKTETARWLKTLDISHIITICEYCDIHNIITINISRQLWSRKRGCKFRCTHLIIQQLMQMVRLPGFNCPTSASSAWSKCEATQLNLMCLHYELMMAWLRKRRFGKRFTHTYYERSGSKPFRPAQWIF